MTLADLIKKKKTAITLPLATAIPAIPAIPAIYATNQAGILPIIAKKATIAVADNKTNRITGPMVEDPYQFSHYCAPDDCWCSSKLPGSDYPAGCMRIKCPQDAPRTAHKS